MTRISERKTQLRAETNAFWRGKPLVILATGHEVLIRQKGQRLCYAVPWIAVMELGAKLASEEARRAKIEARRGRKGTR